MDSSKDRPADQRNGVVVAGLDRSPWSRNAAHWAAAEAACRKATLLLVHAYLLPGVGEPEGDEFDDAITVTRMRGAELLADVAMQVRGSHPGVPVDTRLVHADAVTALREASAGAALTVVGSRRAGRVSDVVSGSVAMTIASTNPAPVAVIPARRQGEGQGSIVVGVDDSPTSDPALAFAFETAAIWRAGLVAVRSWNNVRVDAAVPVHDMIIDKNAIDRDEQLELAARLRVWQRRFPDVAVRRAVARGRPAPSLLHFAPNARLIVVGSRGPRPLHRSASRLDQSHADRPRQLPGGDCPLPGRRSSDASRGD